MAASNFQPSRRAARHRQFKMAAAGRVQRLCTRHSEPCAPRLPTDKNPRKHPTQSPRRGGCVLDRVQAPSSQFSDGIIKLSFASEWNSISLDPKISGLRGQVPLLGMTQKHQWEKPISYQMLGDRLLLLMLTNIILCCLNLLKKFLCVSSTYVSNTRMLSTAATAKSLQSCPTLRPHPWDSPGKNTGVGGQFLLQCMKVKSESEVAQPCPTLSDPVDRSLPGSSLRGIFQARVPEWGAMHCLLRILSTCD